MTKCVLVADDLTGACDAAGRFAAAGLRSVVPLGGRAPEAEVVAFSTDSRDVEPAEARRRLCVLVPEIRRLAPRILFKKIDSTLRGNSGFEIVAALEVFGSAAAVVNPAFPAMGRTVEAGHLLAGDASFQPISLPGFLQSCGAHPCRHVPPGAVGIGIEDGIRFISMEAATDEDLDEIAAELLALPAAVMWTGSAGLAGALARRLGHSGAQRPAPPAKGKALFCLGSDHATTLQQQHRLLARGGDPVLRIPPGRISEDEVRAALGGSRPAALVLSGGDTASLICRAIGAEAIELIGEFTPGIPIGQLRGGAYDGVTVVTKSGGFGGPETLAEIADYFHG